MHVHVMKGTGFVKVTGFGVPGALERSPPRPFPSSNTSQRGHSSCGLSHSLLTKDPRGPSSLPQQQPALRLHCSPEPGLPLSSSWFGSLHSPMPGVGAQEMTSCPGPCASPHTSCRSPCQQAALQRRCCRSQTAWLGREL